MRVTEQMLKFESIRAMTDAEKNAIEIQNRMTTGKDVNKPSDDPLRFVTAARFKSVVNSKEQNLRNLSDARRFLDNNETSLRQTIDIIQRTRILLLQSANETLTTADLQLNAKEVRQTLEGLIQFANSRSVDGAMFGGTKTDADPFEVVRDANGDVTDVIYRGNTAPVSRQIAESTTVDLNFVGSRLFQIDPDTAQSSFSASYAGQKLDLSGFPAGDTTGFFQLQGDRVYFDTANDSLLSIKDRINDKTSEIDATVEGSLVGTSTFASTAAPTAATAGSITLNGTAITIAAGASLDSVIASVNAATAQTGVTASAATVAGGFALQLDGGLDVATTATSNAFQVLGVTDSGSSPTNLTSRNALSYRLSIATSSPDQIIADDEISGRFLERMGITDGTSNAPANQGAGMFTDRSIFKVLIDAIQNLDLGQTAEIRDNRISELDRGLANIFSSSADVAANVKSLENAEIREEGFILQAKEVISASEDLDLAKAISDLRQAQLRLETAIGASQNVPGVNLSQFL